MMTPKSQQHNTMRSFPGFPKITLMISIFLTVILFLIYSMALTYIHKRFEEFQIRSVHVQELTDIITYLDEILTISAYMGAATGDPLWTEKYNVHERKLDSAFQDAIKLEPIFQDLSGLKLTEQANQVLVKMEREAFDRASQGNLHAARQVLASDLYKKNKKIYAAGLAQFNLIVQKRIANYKNMIRQHNRHEFFINFLGFFIIAIIWIFAAYRLNRYQSQKIHYDKRLQRESGAIKASIDGVAILDKNGRYVYLNQAHAAIYGYDRPQDLIGRSWKALYDADEIQRFKNVIFPKLRTEGQWRGETIGIRKDKSKFPQEISLTSLEEGGWVSVVRDIAERKKAENELRISEERYRSLFENMLNGFALHRIVTDKKGRCIDYIFLEVNSSFETLTGLKRKDILGKKVTEVLPGIEKDPFDWIGKYGKVAQTGEEIRFEHYSQSLDMSYTVYAYSPKKDHFAVIFENVTEKKKTQELLHENARFISNIFAGIQDGISVLDKDMNILHVNEVMTRWYESNTPLEGKKCYQCYHNTQEPCQPCPTLRSIKSGKTECDIVPGLPGSPVEWIELYSYPVKNTQTGEVDKVVEFVRDITAKKKAEDTLIEKETSYKSLVDNITGMIYSAKSDWSAEIMTGSTEICGYSQEEISSMEDKWMSIIHPDDKKEVLNEGMTLTKESKNIIQEYRIIHKDGSLRWVEDHKTSRFSEIGSFAGIDGIVLDITNRKKAEEAVHDNRAFLKQIIDLSPNFVFAKDREGHFTLANKAVADAYGVAPEDIIGKTDADFNPNKKEVEHFRKDDLEVLNTGKEIFIPEEIITDSEGKIRWLQTVKKPLRDKSGKIDQVMGIATDITLLKHAQKELVFRVNMERLIASLSANFINCPPESLDKTINDALKELGTFLHIDRSYVFLFSEETSRLSNTHEWCQKGIGSQKDRVQNTPVEEFPWITEKIKNFENVCIFSLSELPSEAEKEKSEFMAQSIKSLINVPIEMEGECMGFIGLDSVSKEKYWEEDVTALLHIVGNIFANAIKKKLAEEELRGAQEILEKQNEELKSLDKIKDGIIRDVSHELKTPVSKHAMAVDLLKRTLKGQEIYGQCEKLFQIMESSVKRQERVIRNILDLSRLEAGGRRYTIETTTLREVIDEVIEDYKVSFSTHQITLYVSIDNIPFNTDKEMLQHVFSNLINNSIKYRSSKTEPWIRIEAEREDQFVTVYVKDNGVGLTDIEKQKAFEKFFQGTASYEGSGVGLSICKMIVKELGGEIRLDSEGRDAGTIVSVKLPLTQNKHQVNS